MIDRATKDKILEAAQIVDVVSDFVVLKKAGANFKGLCPFHDDRTPSFMVSPAKNYCKCFACGKGGSPVGFIMEHEQLAYPDALKYLAKKYGITVQERELTPEEKAAQTERESMFILNEWALKWFQDQMYDTSDGRAYGLAYFRGRGFRDDIVRKFQLGFCPRGKDALTQAALKEGFQEKFLVDTGLSIRRDNGSLYDRYYGRVMFPWFSVSGKVAGFGGRVLDAATKGVSVKYQNSPESSIYSKRRELYGLFQAKQAIGKQDMVYMVEGYTDVISMHQCGIENVVANSGTALTKEQIHLLHRFTGNITLLYDGDEAGIHAAQRGTDMLLADGMNVKILLLPDGMDPDEFARKHTAQEFRDYVAQHSVDFIRFKIELLYDKAKDDPRKLSDLTNEIVTSIAAIPDEITRSFYIRQASQMMQTDEQMIMRAVRNVKKEQRPLSPTLSTKQGNGVDTITAENTAPNENTTAGEDTPAANVTTPLSASGERGRGYEAGVGSGSGAEFLLAQLIVRYGERIVCNVEAEDGGQRALSEVEFIFYSITQDGLTLKSPRVKCIMDEAMLHVHDEGFKAEQYFLNHENRELQDMASRLSMDREQLSSSNKKEGKDLSDGERLMDVTTHVLADFKLAVVREKIKKVMTDMKNPVIIKDSGREIMQKYKDLKAAEKVLAKATGDRVI